MKKSYSLKNFLPATFSLNLRNSLLLSTLILLSCGKVNANANNASNVTIRANDIVIGNPNADIVIVEYMDIQCPACAQWHRTLKRTWPLIQADVKLVLRHYPLTQIHPYALTAAHYIEAARLQDGDGYYKLYEYLIENQSTWNNKSRSDAIATFDAFVQQAGLDLAQLTADAKNRSVTNKVTSDIKLGDNDNVQGTPTLLINNQKISPPTSAQNFYNLIKEVKDQLPTPNN